MTTTTTPTFVPGLAGIPAVESSISYIDGQAGILEYRGIPIEELAAHSTFEETAYLLLYGSLPTQGELDGFRERLSARRALPDRLIETLRLLPGAGHLSNLEVPDAFNATVLAFLLEHRALAG